MELRPGDIFLNHTHGFVGDGILKLQRVLSKDHRADYSHAGIIVSESGTTFESSRKIGYSRFRRGDCACILRWKEMTPAIARAGLLNVLHLEGRAYPWWRLGLHAVGLADNIHTLEWPVCSELVAMDLDSLGLMPEGVGWAGVTPDMLYDIFSKRDGWEVRLCV